MCTIKEIIFSSVLTAKHHADGSFEISLEYTSCPDIEGRTIIISDRCGNGASLVKVHSLFKGRGDLPPSILFAPSPARWVLNTWNGEVPNATIWCADIDDEITAKGYIVPGLGDAVAIWLLAQKMQSRPAFWCGICFLLFRTAITQPYPGFSASCWLSAFWLE